jgi:hypothetical protein
VDTLSFFRAKSLLAKREALLLSCIYLVIFGERGVQLAFWEAAPLEATYLFL